MESAVLDNLKSALVEGKLLTQVPEQVAMSRIFGISSHHSCFHPALLRFKLIDQSLSHMYCISIPNFHVVAILIAYPTHSIISVNLSLLSLAQPLSAFPYKTQTQPP
jgi:hypothetical protein